MKSFLVGLSGDLHPQYQVTWKLTDKEPEAYDAEEWIGKKGITAKGKKCVDRGEVKSVKFIEPLHKPEDDILATEDNGPEEAAGEAVVTEDVAPEEDAPVWEEIVEEPTLF